MGNGNGTFQAAVSYASGGLGADSLTVADVNGDGKLDVLVMNTCDSAGNCKEGVVGVLLGNGDGTFQTALTYLGWVGPHSLTVGDVNGDGKPDVLGADDCANGSTCGSGVVSVLLGNGNGTLATPLLLSWPLPIFAVPSTKVTVPVGVLLNPCDFTVAVNVTACPRLDGLTDEVSVA